MPYRTLISANDTAAHNADPAWRIVDCRHDLTDTGAGERAYRDGHIPNAHFLHLDRDLSGPKTGKNGRHPLPDPETLARRLGHIGISNATQVIAYDDSGGMFAARLWWLLRWLGHDNVAVLDGGLSAWRKAGLPLTDEAPVSSPARFDWKLAQPTVKADDLQLLLHSPDILIVDARAPDRFRGENETLDPVGGHIPGAVNRFFKDNLAADGRFKPAAQLRSEWDTVLNGRRAAAVVNQCGSGVTACHNLLAMEIAGLHGARLYPGSWSEWCSDPARPKATNG
jgi:thiosulfate/3-mercaptopyruvate sulfurtransferase